MCCFNLYIFSVAGVIIIAMTYPFFGVVRTNLFIIVMNNDVKIDAYIGNQMLSAEKDSSNKKWKSLHD